MTIKGAPPNVSERDVFDFFSDIGLMPMNVKIMYDTDGTCNGQVVCEFADPHKARRATTKDGMLFGRGHVQVELVPSGRKRVSDPTQTKSFRPSLLGPRPVNMPNPRFGGGPPGPNPFVQALQGVAPGAGIRSSGPRSRGPNPRFGQPRGDFGPSNGVDRDDRTGGRGRGMRSFPQSQTSEASSFNFGKPGISFRNL